MQIFTRKINESIKTVDSVTITVLSVKGNQVRIGVDAPRDVAMHRDGISERIENDESRQEQTKLGNARVASE